MLVTSENNMYGTDATAACISACCALPHLSKVWSKALNLRHVLQSVKQSNSTLEAAVQLEKQRTASTERQLAEWRATELYSKN